jgi:hypothetical protein
MASGSVIEVLGYAPNNSRCDCEYVACEKRLTRGGHRAGACRSEGVFLVAIHGMQTKLCPLCMRAARQAAQEE